MILANFWTSFAFGFLCAASLSLFIARLGRVVGRITPAKGSLNDGGALGPRVRRFVTEVLLQAKVIRQRPLPGLAHALVFWGFCAFALVTANHFAVGFGRSLLDPHGLAGRVYFRFAALFAVAVSVSILGLFLRRFVARPKWLGEKVSIESGFIAGLILTLMVTYLVGLFNDAPLVWWLHSAALLAFLPLVPHTKHLHLLLSPFAVFFKSEEFAAIPPLQGDEDFGLVTGKDLTKRIALQAFSCVECGRCMEHCPAYNTGKELNPKEIALGLRGYLVDFGPASEEPLLGKKLLQEAAFECTTCGACEFQCPVGVEHVPAIVGLRRGAVNTGAWEDDRGTATFLALEKKSNALGFSPMERDKFVKKEAFPIFDGTQEYCLWLGCMGAYDPRGREIVISFARVMEKLGTTYGVLKKEKCTGDPARRLGNDLLFGQLASENLATMETASVKKIVSICPHCVRTIAKDWREHGVSPEIEHHSEFLARHRDKLAGTGSERPSIQASSSTGPAATGSVVPASHLESKSVAGGESVVFHDPCYLGRYRDVYDEPRKIASLGGTLKEPQRTRERSFCCGAGGGQAFLGEESGERVSHNRALELIATGATTVAAACPFCQTMLRDGLAAVSDAPPKLVDIAEIAAAAILKS